MNLRHDLPKNQHGAVLLVLLFTIFAFASTLFLASVNTNMREFREHDDTRAELEHARQMLIAYAVNYPSFGLDGDGDGFTDDEGPGRLICPDIDNDGLADPGAMECTDNVRGRLPESANYGGNTFILNNAFAGIDGQFWYVVSPNFKEITTTGVNHTTAPTLTIDGEPGYVAVLIAPGEALAFQNRATSNLDPANYLEQGNLAGSDFFNSYPADPNPAIFNDEVVGVRLTEINQIMQEAALSTAIEAVDNYVAQTLPLLVPGNKNVLSNYMLNNGFRWYVEEGYINDLAYSTLLSTWFGLPLLRANLSLMSCPGHTWTYTNLAPLFSGWSESGAPC